MKTVNYMSRPARAPTSFRFRPSDLDRRPAHDDGIIRCEARRTQATWNDGTRQLVTGNSRGAAPAHPANSAALEAFRIARSWRCSNLTHKKKAEPKFRLDLRVS